jgi:anthranilate phosphoribosyltransferase
MSVLKGLSDRLAAGSHLNHEEIAVSVEQLIDESVSPEVKADFLCGLALKGETVEEITAFARALRDKSVTPPIDPAWRRANEILDVCGTGGDRLNTFNISTTVALVCAAAGVPVAKHGNRAITSQAGSADVLEALGVPVDLQPETAAESLQTHGFAFFFAPRYHPAFKHIGPARKLCAGRGQRTIFNVLGPLLNPARPTAQLVGVPRPELCESLARVLQGLGVRRGMVVSGKVNRPTADAGSEQFLDELSTLGPNTIAEFYQERGFTVSQSDAAQFDLHPATLADLAGSDAKSNAAIVLKLLRGDEGGPRRDAVLLNAAAALFVANRARTLIDGWELAVEVLKTGAAARKLAALRAA